MGAYSEKDIADWPIVRLDKAFVVKCLNDADLVKHRIFENLHIIELFAALVKIDTRIMIAADAEMSPPWVHSPEIAALRATLAEFEDPKHLSPPEDPEMRFEYFMVMSDIVRRMLSYVMDKRPGALHEALPQLLRPLILAADANKRLEIDRLPIRLQRLPDPEHWTRQVVRDFVEDDVRAWDIQDSQRAFAVAALNTAATYIRALVARPDIVRLLEVQLKVLNDYDALSNSPGPEDMRYEQSNVFDTVLVEVYGFLRGLGFERRDGPNIKIIRVADRIMWKARPIMSLRHPPSISTEDVLSIAKSELERYWQS